MMEQNAHDNERFHKQEEITVAKIASGVPDSSMVTEDISAGSQNFDRATDPGSIVTPQDFSEQVEMKETGKAKISKPRISPSNAKPKNASGTFLKRVNNQEAKTTYNDTASLNSSRKQPVLNCNISKIVKMTSAADNALEIKNLKLDSATPTENVVQSKGIMQKAKVRPLSKGPPTITKEEPEAILSASSEDAKPDRVGKLPSYGFSFRCDERAQRRKEFYTNLEEKINAKEMEESNLQAKSKETQAAEIKMLRKSLIFKATPMPSFYQEPAPSKVELKKIPTTRPRSPKLGRNKRSSIEEVEGKNNSMQQSRRLSLDQRIERKKPIKVPSPAHAKKPSRRSLPRLPSEKTSLQNPVEETTLLAPKHDNASKGDTALAQEDNKHKNMANGDTALAQGREPFNIVVSGETQSLTDNGLLLQDTFQSDSEQLCVAAEH